MREDERGSAMIAVLCVLMVSVMMALALLHTAARAGRRDARRKQREQCMISAVSVSECMAAAFELEKYMEEDGAWVPQTEFQKFLKDAAEDGETTLELRLDDGSGLPGNITAEIELNVDDDMLFPEEAVLYLKVTAESGEVFYTVGSCFRFECSEGEEDDTEDEDEGEDDGEETGHRIGRWKYQGRIMDAE